jgi:hypothetical protein
LILAYIDYIGSIYSDTFSKRSMVGQKVSS